MGIYWYGQMNIKGRSKDLNKFEEKYPQIHQFFTEFDIWPWIDEYERTETEINVNISNVVPILSNSCQLNFVKPFIPINSCVEFPFLNILPPFKILRCCQKIFYCIGYKVHDRYIFQANSHEPVTHRHYCKQINACIYPNEHRNQCRHCQNTKIFQRPQPQIRFCFQVVRI